MAKWHQASYTDGGAAQSGCERSYTAFVAFSVVLATLPACQPALLALLAFRAELPGYLGSKQAWRPGGHAPSLSPPK